MSNKRRMIWCCGCQRDVLARLTGGAEIYPHRQDLDDKPFWRCDACGNYVGCHHKRQQRTLPLGTIPTSHVRRLRKQLHDQLDPLWRRKQYGRDELYGLISRRLGYEFHIGEVASVDEVRKVSRILEELKETT